jgi:mannan endo-1,4-beta-mannosidase
MAGYAANDANGTVLETELAPSSRWVKVEPKKGSNFTLTPNMSDDAVYMDEFVNFLVHSFGKASSGGIRGYSLDNEPALWNSTHARMHPAAATVSEMINKSINLSNAVKSVDSTAEIFGAVTYGYSENTTLQDAPDWNTYGTQYPNYLEAFLAGMRQGGDTHGKRLLDALDIHWYPEARGVDAAGNSIRITEDSTDV